MTGATSGIGLCAARALVRMGADLVLVARSAERADAALRELRARAPQASISAYFGDLSSIADMKRVGTEIATAHPSIDVLINCAGAVFGERGETADGLERTFATNHLSYFVLTNILRGNLIAAAPARVVNVSSRAHRGERLDFDDLQAKRSYHWFRAYGRSKLANILFTRESARRFAGTGVTVNCLHPGFVKTRLGANNRSLLRRLIRLAMVVGITPERGAETIVYLASSPEAASHSGEYFFRCRPITPDAPARDDEAARELWDISAKLTGLAV